MTYDPFQIQSALSAYPFQSPYMQLNPVAAFNPLTAPYLPTAGISPHHLHLAQILAARAAVPQLSAASPWSNGLNNLNNPLLAAAVLQNPLIAASLENPLLNPILAQTQFGGQPYGLNPYIGQTVPQYGQMGSPYGQIQQPFGQIPQQFGQTQPQLGQMGSPYGQTPQQFGHNGSPYGQIQPQYGQMGSPFGQIPPQFGQLGQMLAPQSWVGQPGLYGNH